MSVRADQEFYRLAAKANADVATLGAHSLLLEAAMRILMKNGLLQELVSEMAAAPTDERDRLQLAVHELESKVSLLERQLQDAKQASSGLRSADGIEFS